MVGCMVGGASCRDQGGWIGGGDFISDFISTEGGRERDVVMCDSMYMR